jgi:exodeoxyribonuclease V gamma subunit
VRAFFQQRLQVNFRSEENDIPDSEPFTLDGLERYQLNLQLLNALVSRKMRTNFSAAIVRRGSCLMVRLAKCLGCAVSGDAGPAERVIECRQPGKSIEIDLNCNGVQLTGWLPQVQQDGLLRWRPSMLSVSQGLQLWLEHLVYSAGGNEGESRLFVRKEGNGASRQWLRAGNGISLDIHRRYRQG